MIRRSRNLLAVLALATLGAAIAASPASAVTPAPAWRVTSDAQPTNLVPGVSDGRNAFMVTVINTGGAPSSGDITVTDDLPAGFAAGDATYSAIDGFFPLRIYDDYDSPNGAPCDPGPPVVCHFNHPIPPGERFVVQIPLVQVPAAAPGQTTVTNHVTVSGGGAANPAEVTDVAPFNADAAPFGIQQLSAWFTGADGSEVTQAGAHPFAFRFRVGVNTSLDVARAVGASEDPRNVSATLPPGVVVDPNPTTTPTCSEADFEQDACPAGAAVGQVNQTLAPYGVPGPGWVRAAYNIEAPPGSASSFGFNVAGLGFFVHILGGVDPAHGYALTAHANDITEFGNFSESTVELWGDPSDPAHDTRRGACASTNASGTNTCPAAPNPTPFLTMPSACSSSLTASVTATSWQDQNPGGPVSASTQVENADGTPAPVTGCDSLDFNPSLTARPTTNVADSPSGLDVDLQVPQTNSQNTLATSTLRKAVVTLPQGLTINPSSANGLEACSSAQIGIDPGTGTPNGKEPTCPDASKLGTVQVTTPLLADPLPGSVYLAKPHDNPFGSQLAIYIVVDDPQTGVIIKLPGKVEADPSTGQLTTTVDQNPQLPFSEFKLNFFGGATGALRTPDACGNYSTTSELTPWSSSTSTPVTPPDDTYSISQGPGAGGDCPAPADQQPNSPSFDAGTVSPTAGNFSPFVLNLHRDDATQQFSSVTLSPPPGLVAKLAGTPACSDAGIAQAQGRSSSGDGALEQSNPSCPDASKVGTVHVGAGAGPSPYYVTGNVYLAGPYKGAPLSFVIITPAVAGPYDLGVVVTRVAISLDPSTAQITATADPIPDRLTVDGDGFPLDVRSVQMKLDKPDFTLNGSSCDPTSLTGSLLSTQNQTASLSEPFQLAECANLGFKPRLGMRLRGGHFRNGHPAFTSVLNARAGDANIGKASVILPPSMQLDQSHIQAPCTRPQFAADQCPAASIIGSVVATSPLLDYKLSGPVYLRTGDNPLPDMVLDLHGPASQPIRIDQVGKIDTVHARLRTTFQGVPDAPISQAIIRLVGGHKGLLVNNTNLCKQPNRAAVFLDGHNNATADSHPRIALKCPKPRKHKRHHKRHLRHRRHS